MKRVLIWDDFELKNIGGPSGYLYNFKQYLSKHPNSQIVFLSDVLIKEKEQPSGMLCEKSNMSVIDKFKRGLKQNAFVSFLLDRVFLFKRSCSELYNYTWNDFHRRLPDDLVTLNLDEYDYVHFHLSFQASQFLLNRKDYGGKVILTSHCPCSYTDEIIQSKKGFLYKLFRPMALYNEYRTFRSVDYLMFPCIGAREPYEKVQCLKYAISKSKVFYVPSAINEIPLHFRNRDVLDAIGIPSDAFVISFFGRHSRIKGYDIIRDRCIPLMDKYPFLHVVCGGIGEVSAPIHERWHELGFVSNVSDYLSASDLYICANRDTYFDLSVLEVLRSGTCLALSDNGGNRFFYSIVESERCGLHFFSIQNCDALDSIICKMIELKNTNTSVFDSIGRSNRILYERYFTHRQYVKNYIYAINSLS